MSIVFFDPNGRQTTWRNLWPAKELARRGHDVKCYSYDSGQKGQVLMGTDTVVLHLTSRIWIPAAGLSPIRVAADVRRYAKRMILSLDDDWTALGRVQDPDVGVRLLQVELPAVAKMTDLIVCSTPYLAEQYSRWTRTVVARNYLPKELIGLKPYPPKDRLAYMGTWDIHHRDVELLRPYAAELPPMHMIGGGRRMADLLTSWGVRDVTWTDPTNSHRTLYREMGSCRAGIVPLVDNRFNAAKSWIKPYEFMAQGVPVAVSPHQEYADLADRTVESNLLIWTDADRWGMDARYIFESNMQTHPETLLDEHLYLEARGGNEWEQALDLTPARHSVRMAP